MEDQSDIKLFQKTAAVVEGMIQEELEKTQQDKKAAIIISEEEAKQILEKCKTHLKNGRVTENGRDPLNTLHLTLLKLYVSLRQKL